ncbi:MAG: GNAT family N-acetyltransferase [Actinomycetota bacterium]|nr:GNAT family N-acetyltransferase [Actinomycetota bacterium]
MIRLVTTAAEWATFRALVLEYSEWLDADLCFQGFDEEVADLARQYGPPNGAAFLAENLGCAGVRPFADEGVCELKRMYVRADARGGGHGRALAEHAVAEARRLGYRTMRLDTLATMTAAIHVYEALGFREIDAYRANPLDAPRFFELVL